MRERPRFTPGAPVRSLPFHVVVTDGVPPDSGAELAGVDGVVVIDLDGTGAAEPSALGLRVTREMVYRLSRDAAIGESPLGAPDGLSLAEAEALARQLAPLRPASSGAPAEDALAANTTLTSLLGIADPNALDVPALWRSRAPRDRFRVPVGNDANGLPVELDIKESAQGGMGPHGLVVGATGSGKSELLRTLVLGLATTHRPEELNFVLVDFKGGATFLGLDRLPHVSAVITNLADELPLVDRMRDALHGEMVRRQELFRTAGNYASLRDYAKARSDGVPLALVPTLFVVLDEFSELLAAKPEFIDLFVMIGRVGRSLGVHLLLASQRLEEGRLRGLETQLSYRIGLRMFSAMESRTVLGVPDAYELPSQPGNAYLKVDTTGMTRFKAAYVSGPVGSKDPPGRVAALRVRPAIVPFGPAYVELMPAEQQPAPRSCPHSGAVQGHAARCGGRAARWPGTGGAPDLAAAAGRAAGTRPATAAAGDHAARPDHPLRGSSGGTARRAGDRRPALRAAPRPALGGPVRRRGSRGGGRRPAQRQVHGTAHPGMLARSPAHPGRSPVLHPGLRRRRAQRARQAPAHRRDRQPPAGRPGPPRCRRDAVTARTARTRLRRPGHRLDRDLPQAAGGRPDRRGRLRRRVLDSGRLAHTQAGLRGTRAVRHRACCPRSRLRHPPARRDQQMVGVPPGRPRPVRDPPGTTPRRPLRVRGRPRRSGERAIGRARAGPDPRRAALPRRGPPARRARRPRPAWQKPRARSPTRSQAPGPALARPLSGCCRMCSPPARWRPGRGRRFRSA